jgi:hypothetical protein
MTLAETSAAKFEAQVELIPKAKPFEIQRVVFPEACFD